MKLKRDFSKDKLIIVAIALIISVVSLGNWIATSFGTFDDDMSSMFYEAMDIPFFRGWASFTVNDGYVEIIAYAFPLGIILIESLILEIKKHRPNNWISQHHSDFKYIIFLMAILFEFLVLYFYWNYNWKDTGFGAGYNTEFIVGPEYQIPEWVVSEIFTNIIFIGLTYYFHNHLAKRPDFLELKIWRPIVTIFLFMAFSYTVVMSTKAGINRPYWYGVHFLDNYDHDGITFVSNNTTVGGYHVKGTLQRFGEIYGWDKNSPWYKYMSSNSWTGWIGGFKDGTKNLIPWPSNYRNWLWNQEGGSLPLGASEAFPSGHMLASSAIAMMPTVIFVANNKDRNTSILKYLLVALGFVYVIDMLFALQISSSHWWSDSTFSLGFVPLFYLMGYESTYWVMHGFNKAFKTKEF